MLLINKFNILKEIYKMKKMRKIIPAFAMLLVAVIMVSSASYAWFSMNSTVTATGMTVKAQSDTEYLVINAGSTFDKTGTETSANTSSSQTSLKPVKLVSSPDFGNILADGDNGNWEYGYSNSDTSSAVNGSYELVGSGKIGNYVASETFSIGLTEGYGVTSSADNLILTGVTLPAKTGISVIVVCGDNVYHTQSDLTNGTVLMAANATTTGSLITVYYYINGEDTNVTSANMSKLTGSVVLTFGLGTGVAPTP